MGRVKGPKIGAGQSRTVYENKQDISLVIKKRKLYPKLSSTFQRYMIDENFLEYLNYRNFCEFGLESWLSPCEYANGDILMQRASPLQKGKQYSVPRIFSNHYSNWGIINDRLVCIDYDFLLFPVSPIFNNKQKKTKSIFFKMLVFRDSLQYIKKITNRHGFTKPPFNYFLIDSKYQLSNLLHKTTRIIF